MQKGGGSWTSKTSTNWIPFETMSKRRYGFPSETKVKRGVRIVHGDKELVEKVGRDDLCPCGSGKRFKKCCRNSGCFRRRESGPLLLESDLFAAQMQTPGGFFVRWADALRNLPLKPNWWVAQSLHRTLRKLPTVEPCPKIT